ncbi:MAG: DUF1801 domain-containing protein [Flavobacteriales bacterium]
MNPKVDEFLSKTKKWQKELALLRVIILECGLDEDFKWKHPCYTFKGNNIVLIHGFKDYCALLFMKGALLKDSENMLIQQTENVQSGRQIRFTNAQQIMELKPILKAYIFEAIEVEKLGLKVDFKKSTNLTYPEELQKKLDEDKAFKTAFEALTPGRQRAYNLYFSAPKQSATRVTRIEKYTQQILDGFGFNDCTCGFTKKKPNCDGSHKHIEGFKKP